MRLADMYPYRVAALLLCAWTLSMLGAPPAAASCATAPGPSPYAFVGTVIATSQGDRVVQVVTDGGATVTVLGTTGRSDNAFTSVDRRYALGGRYEFHPLNDESPYSDNSCTATRQLSGPSLSAIPPQVNKGVLPAWLPVDEQAGPLGYLLFFGPIALGLGVLIVGLRGLVRRQRTASRTS